MSKDCSWDIRPIQAEVLKIFKAFAEICTKYGLQYFAAYGTALGAIRHQGFIPWDDDFDVIMPRTDFMKFAAVARNELPEHLKYKRGGIGYPSPIYFAHIIDETDDLVERLSSQSRLSLEIGPYIDIFVLDGVPDDINEMKAWRDLRRRARMCQMFRYPETIGNRNGVNFIKGIMGRLGGLFVNGNFPHTSSNDEMMRVMDEVYCKWSYEESKCVAEYMFFRNKASRLLPKALFGEGRMVPFCDTEICVPSGVEIILSQYYGDYMKFPPEKDRKPPHIMKLMYEGHV